MTYRKTWQLKQMQSLPIQAKIQMTRQRIREWIDEFGEDGVYVSFSGGKDSTVLRFILFHSAASSFLYISFVPSKMLFSSSVAKYHPYGSSALYPFEDIIAGKADKVKDETGEINLIWQAMLQMDTCLFKALYPCSKASPLS